MLELRLALACMVFAACAAPKPPPPPVAVIEPAQPLADASAPVVAEDDAGAPSSPPPPCTKLVLAPSSCVPPRWPADKPPLGSEEQNEWFRSRGATRPPAATSDTACYALEVGPANEAALACDETTRAQKGSPATSDHVYRVLHRVRIYVVRKGRTVTVFDQPTSFDVYDKLELDDGALFAVAALLASPQGAAIDIAETGAGACAEALRVLAEGRDAAKRALDRPATAVRWATFDSELVTRICAGVGRHVWKAGAYARPRPASAAAGSSFF